MNNLTKLTVNLIQRSVDMLDSEHERSGDTRTDIVNRAIQLYGAAMESVNTGLGVVLHDTDGRRLVLVVQPMDQVVPVRPAGWFSRLWRRR